MARPIAMMTMLPPRGGMADLAGLARRRLERDGVVVQAVRTADRGQLVRLRRLARHLARDPGLAVHFGDHTDGFTQMTVFPVGDGPRPGWWGGPMGAAEDDPAEVHVEVLEGAFWDALGT